jgi:hypothetical protein
MRRFWIYERGVKSGVRLADHENDALLGTCFRKCYVFDVACARGPSNCWVEQVG